MLISKSRLKAAAETVGISELGITTAEPLDYMRDRLLRRINEKRTTLFEEQNPEARLAPDKLLDGCRSIITFALPYTVTDASMPNSTDEPRGLVARFARVVDYHKLIGDKAARLVNLVKKETASQFKYVILSDQSPLLERELARNAGIGWIGENCTLINTRYGSYTTLGTILIDQDLETDQPAERDRCEGCSLCRDACPTGAITEPYILNPGLCLSYLSQASGIFPRNLRPALGNRIYGCDRCQEVCPHNQSVENSTYLEHSFLLFPAEPYLIPLLSITRKEFDLTIGLTAAGWRGKTALQRNAIIALGNSKNELAIQPLSRLLENDSRAVIRLHAAWALGKLGGTKARFALGKSLCNDPDEAVRNEVSFALDNFS